MEAKECSLSLTGDIWQPSQPLPTKSVLCEMIHRIGCAWELPELTEQVKISYNPRLSTTLGRAIFNDMHVELNPRLLRAHPEELPATLAHELAHLVVNIRYGRVAPHGREFKTLMRAVNLSPKATHNLPVTHLRRGRKKYLYLHRCCDCGYKFVARSARKQYYCLACGPDMKWDIFRLPNTPSGQKLLKHLQSS